MTHHTGSDEGRGVILDRSNLKRLIGAMREGYAVAVPEVTTDFGHGFTVGWRAAIEALDDIADLMPNLPHPRDLLLAWIDDQRQLLPEYRTPAAHGKAELLRDLHTFLAERPTDGAGSERVAVFLSEGGPVASIEQAETLGLGAAFRSTCAHEWHDRGEGQDEWRECWLCGKQEDR